MGSSGSKTKIIENQKETGTKIQAVNAFSATGKTQIKQNNKNEDGSETIEKRRWTKK